MPASNDYVTNIIHNDSDIQALSLGCFKCVIDVFKSPIWIASKSEHRQSSAPNGKRTDSSTGRKISTAVHRRWIVIGFHRKRT
jgi:hypothetical protein